MMLLPVILGLALFSNAADAVCTIDPFAARPMPLLIRLNNFVYPAGNNARTITFRPSETVDFACPGGRLVLGNTPTTLNVVTATCVAGTTFTFSNGHRLTASLFGQVVRRKAYTPCHNLVKACLKKSQFWSEATEYGIAKEKVAIALFEDKSHLKVRESGLWVDLENGFLGASPDGIIDSENALVEVKCMFSATKLELSSNTVAEICQKLKGKICLQEKNGAITLKKTHNYYYQIQGQLNIAKMQKCYFIIYVNDKVELFIQEIERDEMFWKQHMLPKLISFYKTCVAPEIIRKNIEKGRKCVDPPNILKSMAEYEEKNKNKKKK